MMRWPLVVLAVLGTLGRAAGEQRYKGQRAHGERYHRENARGDAGIAQTGDKFKEEGRAAAAERGEGVEMVLRDRQVLAERAEHGHERLLVGLAERGEGGVGCHARADRRRRVGHGAHQLGMAAEPALQVGQPGAGGDRQHADEDHDDPGGADDRGGGCRQCGCR